MVLIGGKIRVWGVFFFLFFVFSNAFKGHIGFSDLGLRKWFQTKGKIWIGSNGLGVGRFEMVWIGDDDEAC